jgi:A/G-specific adenine glycosylase
MEQLLSMWFETNGRDFPWRNTKNPFHILIAEMLLRRTTATAVARVYPRFIRRFDTPESLVRSRLSTIEKHVASLGLQKLRAQHLKETARKLVSNYNDEVPSNFKELYDMPGVGRYVASAVLNFAFGKAISLVDGNIVHLISRVFDIEFEGPADDEAWSFMESFGSNAQHSVFYWSIIDLVATVCIRSSPRCSVCPLKQICSWNKKREEQDGIA